MSEIISEGKNQKAKIFLSYSDRRIQNMKSINEKFCIATEQLLLRKIQKSNLDVDIESVEHSTVPNGVLDMEMHFSINSNDVNKLSGILQSIEQKKFGINGIDLAIEESV